MAGTYHIVGADEVLEGEGGGKSGIRRQGIRVDNVEKSEGVLRFSRFLLKGSFGCDVWFC